MSERSAKCAVGFAAACFALILKRLGEAVYDARWVST